MVGHLEVPGLTTDQPTSLTPGVYELLRSGGYGGPPFDGPVFTDDLSSMKAISDHFGVAEAALRALQAGRGRRPVGHHHRGARRAGPAWRVRSTQANSTWARWTRSVLRVAG